MLEIINQNRKDNLLKIKNDIYNKPFLEGYDINTIDFISNFKTILDSNGANIKLCNELFNFLRVSFPDSSLNEVVKYSATNNITRNVADFMCSNNKFINIDICPVNNCMSFHEDTNTLTYCTLCHSRRFTKCSKRNCITKSYDECEHSLQERIPVKCIYVEEREARIVVNENHERIKLPRKFINDIYENWHEKKQIDSWFMMKDITKMPVEGEYLISHYHFYLFNTLHFQFIQMITYCITCSRRIQTSFMDKIIASLE